MIDENTANKIRSNYKYLEKTREGYPIVDIYQDRFGRLHIIAKRLDPRVNDYVIGKAYDPATGEWKFGIYMCKDYSQAKEMLLEGSDGPFTHFDPTDPKDVEFENDAIYNYNHVDTHYLKRANHHDSSFDTYEHSDFLENPRYDGKYYPTSRRGWREMKRDYNRMNRYERNLDIKGGKYAERRAKLKFWKKAKKGKEK